MAVKQFILIFILIGISNASAEPRNTDFHVLAQTRGWKALLHVFEGSRSEIVNTDFFLSPQSRVDPEAELRQSILDFTSSTRILGVLKQTPYCAFPARVQWLTEHGFDFPKQECKDQDEFVQNISPKSLTLVFSSAYPNNPASLFGHTMIRINQEKQNPLLDYGVNYAASIPEGEIGIKYLFKGLFGLYSGAFGISPFYQKVLEYNEAESRDLWEYDLAFTEAESLFWVKHLWELRFFSQFKYEFLDKNCSYQMIRTLQVIRPEISDWLPENFLYTLPGETIRVLKRNHPEFFLGIHFRPSHFRVLNHRYRFLNAKQKAKFRLDLKDGSFITNEADPYVLETLNSYYEYVKIQQQENAEQSIKEVLRKIRVLRAKMGGVTEFPVMKSAGGRTNQPDLAHPTRRISLTASGGSNQLSDIGIRVRLGLHDLLNRDDGYEANFGVSGGDLEVSKILDSRGKSGFRIKRFELVDLVSLQPMNSVHFPVSWQIFSGWRPLLERSPYAEKNTFETSGGAGFTLEPFQDHLWMGAFINIKSIIDRDTPKNKWASLSLEPFMFLRLNERLKGRVRFTSESGFQFSSALANRASVQVAYAIGSDFEIAGEYKQVLKSYLGQNSFNQFSVGLGKFF